MEASASYHTLLSKVPVQIIDSTDTQTANQYGGVHTYPTLVLLKNGVAVQQYPYSNGDDAATAILALINAG
jgi:hypothetical protein